MICGYHDLQPRTKRFSPGPFPSTFVADYQHIRRERAAKRSRQARPSGSETHRWEAEPALSAWEVPAQSGLVLYRGRVTATDWSVWPWLPAGPGPLWHVCGTTVLWGATAFGVVWIGAEQPVA